MALFGAGSKYGERIFQGAHFTGFFYAGALIAIIAPGIVALSMSGLISFSSTFGPVTWHGHEMFHAYLAVILTGCFVATGAITLSRVQYLFLLVLWGVGRIATIMSDHLGVEAATLLDLLFPAFVTVRVLVASYRNRGFVPSFLYGSFLLYLTGHFVWHLPVSKAPLWGTYISLGAVSFLLLLAGAHITRQISYPATLEKQPETIKLHIFIESLLACSLLAAFIGMGALLTGWNKAGLVAGWSFIIAACLTFARLVLWRSWQFYNQPKILIYHTAFLWTTVSFCLLGGVYLGVLQISFSTALHAFVSGALGIMTLAIMLRACDENYGAVSSTTATALCALANLGALLRVCVEWLPMEYSYGIRMAALVWSGAFLLFLCQRAKQYVLHANPSPI